MTRARARRGPVRAVAVAVLCGLALLLGAAPAFAHTRLQSSDPADGASVATRPARVSLTFNEAMQAGFTTITVVGPDGTRVPDRRGHGRRRHSVTVGLPPLGPAGRYEIGYRVVSDDGHPVTGSVAFTLTTAAGRPGRGGRRVRGRTERRRRPPRPPQAARRGARRRRRGTPVWPWIVGAVVLVGGGVVAALRLGRGMSPHRAAGRASGRHRLLPVLLGRARGRRRGAGRACSPVRWPASPLHGPGRRRRSRGPAMDAAGVACVGLTLRRRAAADCRARRRREADRSCRPADRAASSRRRRLAGAGADRHRLPGRGRLRPAGRPTSAAATSCAGRPRLAAGRGHGADRGLRAAVLGCGIARLRDPRARAGPGRAGRGAARGADPRGHRARGLGGRPPARGDRRSRCTSARRRLWVGGLAAVLLLVARRRALLDVRAAPVLPARRRCAWRPSPSPGVLNAYVRLPSLSALVTTGYGWLVVTKIGCSWGSPASAGWPGTGSRPAAPRSCAGPGYETALMAADPRRRRRPHPDGLTPVPTRRPVTQTRTLDALRGFPRLRKPRSASRVRFRGGARGGAVRFGRAGDQEGERR